MGEKKKSSSCSCMVAMVAFGFFVVLVSNGVRDSSGSGSSLTPKPTAEQIEVTIAKKEYKKALDLARKIKNEQPDIFLKALRSYARGLPASNAKGNLEAYSELVKLDPKPEYFAKIERYKKAIQASRKKNLTVPPFTVTKRESDPYKENVYILLEKRASKQELTAIAKKVRKMERSFIFVDIPETKAFNTPWATTHFTPKLEVEIMGLTENAKAKLIGTPLMPGEIYRWFEPGLTANLVIIFENGDKICILFADGSKLVKPLTRAGKRLNYPNDHGEYVVIEFNGNLAWYGSSVKIKSLIPTDEMEEHAVFYGRIKNRQRAFLKLRKQYEHMAYRGKSIKKKAANEIEAMQLLRGLVTEKKRKNIFIVKFPGIGTLEHFVYIHDEKIFGRKIKAEGFTAWRVWRFIDLDSAPGFPFDGAFMAESFSDTIHPGPFPLQKLL